MRVATNSVASADDPLDPLFDALADATRRAIVVQLVRHGPATATALAEGRAMTRQAVVKHLRSLVDAGLAHPQRSGREVLYAVDAAPLAQVIGWVLDAGGQWDRRIDRLRAT